MHLLTHQVAQLKALTTARYYQKNDNSTYICEHVNLLASTPASSLSLG